MVDGEGGGGRWRYRVKWRRTSVLNIFIEFREIYRK